MGDSVLPKMVKAIYNFKGSNTDELCFLKGDIITITQCIDGGWWEGSLAEKTGWFPSNYVKEIQSKPYDPGINFDCPNGDDSLEKRKSMLFNHNVVLQSMIDSEQALVSEVQSLIGSILRPLQSSKVLSGTQYVLLVGNLEEILQLHDSLLDKLSECAKLPVHQQKVGEIFMSSAPQFKTLYSCYCANHPKAFSILQRKKEALKQFLESNGTSSIMSLTTSLSKPFTRLDKYPSLLKELERHTEESHVDRGDTQRAICIYRGIYVSCQEIRRLKEMEFEVLNGNFKNWEGEDIRELGEVLTMSHVYVTDEDDEVKDHLYVLFPSVLVILSVSPRLSGYIYEGKIPVAGMDVEQLEDDEDVKFAFEISGNLIDRRIVKCTCLSEQQKWVELLSQQAKLAPPYSAKPQSLQILGPSSKLQSKPTQPQTATVDTKEPHKAQQTIWTMSCLRPSPPIRPSPVKNEEIIKSPKVARKSSFKSRKAAGEELKPQEDDALLLKVIESYCTSAKTRQTVNSSIFDMPQLIIVEDEKIIEEKNIGNHIIIEEKSLVDTVYSLKDQLKDLKEVVEKITLELNEEKRARRRLELNLRKSVMKSAGSAYAEILSIYDESY